MNTRFFNARILTLHRDATFSIIEGELWVVEDSITFIGIPDATTKRPSQGWQQEIDVKQNLLMPGFKNAHTHSAMTFLRSAADDLPLQKWLFEAVLPREQKLTAEDVYWLSALAVLEYLTSGVTTIFDMYLQFQEVVSRVCIQMGMRLCMVDGLNDFGGSVELMEENYLRYNEQHPLLRYFLGVHGEYTTALPLLEKTAALVQKYRAPFYTHNAETLQEVSDCKGRYGLTPTQLFEKLGLHDYGGGAYHGVWLEAADMEIFARRKMSVVTNPASNLKLASGIAPIQQLLEFKINVAIGTDGPASNNCLDMFREMFLVTGLAKVKAMDATAVDANRVLYMATAGGAKACYLPNCDALAVGKQADIIMIDLQQPNMQPLLNIPKNIVYSGSKTNIKMTMIAGEIRYYNGEYRVGMAVDEIYRQVNSIVERING